VRARVILLLSGLLVIVGMSLVSVSPASAFCDRTENEKEGDGNRGCQVTGPLLNEILWTQATRIDRLLYCVKDLLTRSQDKWTNLACTTVSPRDEGLFALVDLGDARRGPKANPLVNENIPINFEGTSGAGTLETLKGTKVSCTKGTNKGKIETPTEGSVELVFTGCTSSGFKCRTVGASEGEIKTSGTTKLVFDSLEPLGVALLLSVAETTFECTSLVKVKVKGNILLLVTPVGTETERFEIVVKQSKGDPTDNKYWNAEGKEEKPSLLSSINGAAFESSADESAENTIKTSEMVTIEG
jgi:hypothetical protein